MDSSKKATNKSVLNTDISWGRISLTQKAIFAKHLAIMLKAGITLSESLEILLDSTSGRFKKIIAKLLKSIEAGQSFSSALSQYPRIFTSIFTSATSIGEKSGTLYENLESISVQLEKERDMRAKVFNALLYPVVVLIAAFFLGLVIAFVVLPKITPLFLGLKVTLPLSTRVLMAASVILEKYGIYIFVGAVVFLILIIWLSRQKFFHPFSHWLILKTPIAKKISRNVSLAKFCRTLAMLLKSGLSIDEAIKITGDSLNNYYYRQSTQKIYDGIGRGTTLADNLEVYKKYYPTMLVRMVKVGEKSGKLEESLFYLASFYENEVDNETKSLATSIEPILLATIGIVVGFLALSIITPIYSITSSIRN